MKVQFGILLPICHGTGSIFACLLGASGCAGDTKRLEPANVLDDGGSGVDGAGFIRTRRRTCSNGCDTSRRS